MLFVFYCNGKFQLGLPLMLKKVSDQILQMKFRQFFGTLGTTQFHVKTPLIMIETYYLIKIRFF